MQDLSLHLRIVTFRQGQVVAFENDFAEKFGFIKTGKLKAVYLEKPDQKLFDDLKEYEIYGHVPILLHSYATNVAFHDVRNTYFLTKISRKVLPATTVISVFVTKLM